ncbi:FAD/NAD(P)-binding domain-containing protein [Sistotremastrum suecicum HHB10207 ss-3]|uniref:FAD/NAD(P)-binding domain-containing protein n=1 Tax=Sistotremastrum suecicum HHB10207 ss-3 TaxID=1314776 RepID=A0A166CZ53_9AGAM|nr:FAD/NAD(P)-binding domain-containing protein [Sistotremastrum suecicum HHB10207 ss-3]
MDPVDDKPTQSRSSVANARSGIVIIGAGIGGISTAIALIEKLGFHDFIMYEKADDVGGTWRDNTYPGCACDVSSHWYSLSTEINPDWTQRYAQQPEILQYWKSLTTKHNLSSYIQLHTLVTNAIWDSSAQEYIITTKDAHSGVQQTTRARIIISAIGGFVAPSYPVEISGKEQFQGRMWHSSRWRHDVPLQGLRVGVIGNGASAAQIIPEIAKDATTTIVNFCRTPSWFIPREQFSYSKTTRWIFRYIPLVARLYRAVIMARHDVNYFALWPKKSEKTRKIVRKRLIEYIKSLAPKEYHEQLIPTYPPGCKRLVLDPGYLKSLRQPNVSLNWDAIKEVTPTGLRMQGGNVVDLDVIVFATGYVFISNELEVTGSKGITIREYWERQKGPTAYLGTTMSGFPNYFTLLGPNTATGHASVIFSEESQINYILKMVKPVLDGDASSFEVSAEASEAYNRDLQERLSRTVWTDCRSFYRSGGRHDGKVVATFPGTLTQFWWLTRSVRWEDYIGVNAESWMEKRKRGSVGRITLMSMVTALCLMLWGVPRLRK